MRASSARRPFVVVDVEWLPHDEGHRFPEGRELRVTGYRELLGFSDLFSVYVKLGDGQPAEGVHQRAKIYAPVEAMRERLPAAGAALVLTDGARPFARCLVLEHGDEPDVPAAE